MNLLAIVRILQIVIPALAALFAASNAPAVSHNFGAGASVLDSGLLQGGLLPILAGVGSWLAGFVLNRSNGITKETIELIQAIIAFSKDQSRANGFRIVVELLGVLDFVAAKFGIDISGELTAIEAKIIGTLSPVASSRRRRVEKHTTLAGASPNA